MRRKSARTAAKSSPEKAKPEPARRGRRSKRKKSSSEEESDKNETTKDFTPPPEQRLSSENHSIDENSLNVSAKANEADGTNNTRDDSKRDELETKQTEEASNAEEESAQIELGKGKSKNKSIEKQLSPHDVQSNNDSENKQVTSESPAIDNESVNERLPCNDDVSRICAEKSEQENEDKVEGCSESDLKDNSVNESKVEKENETSNVDTSDNKPESVEVNTERKEGNIEKNVARQTSRETEEHKTESKLEAKKPLRIKLRRNSLFEVIERKMEEEPVPRKKKWETTALSNLSSSLFKVNTEDIKIVCPELKLIEEKDVKLEIRRKSHEEIKHEKRHVETSDSVERPDYGTQSSVTSNEGSSTDTAANIIALNRKISIVDDTASKLRPPPSPPKNPVSSVLYITNLVRPFTIKQLKELLERTGKIKEDGFWTDRIKSKCYVDYETTEEAEATRNALHGVNWPIGNGKKLVIEYATAEEMDMAKNPPPPVVAPAPERKSPEKENKEPHIEDRKVAEDRRDVERERRRGDTVREWDIGKESRRKRSKSKSRSRSRSRGRSRKHSRRSHTPEEDFIARKQRKLEEVKPQKLMDDLFLKTKTMPSIYWQPLSPEEIAMKQQQRLLRMEEHKRRLEENSRNRAVRDAGRGSYRRRYD